MNYKKNVIFFIKKNYIKKKIKTIKIKLLLLFPEPYHNLVEISGIIIIIIIIVIIIKVYIIFIKLY